MADNYDIITSSFNLFSAKNGVRIMNCPYRLAEVVVSTAGRDQGKYYLVVGYDNVRYVLIADGDKKRFEHPKRKNPKHLRSACFVNEEISIWLANGKRIRNEDIKRAIQDYEKIEEAN